MRLYPSSREEAERWKADYEFLGYTAFFEKDALVVVTQGKRKKKEKKDGKKTTRRVDSRRNS